MTDTATKTRLAHVQSVCGTEEHRPYLHSPAIIGDWLVGSNGHAIVAYPAVDGDPDGDWTTAACEYTSGLLADRPPETLQTTVARLREWAGPGHATVPCEVCGHEHECESAYEAGRISRGTLAGRHVNRHLLAWVLREAPDSEVTVHVPDDPVKPIHIVGDPWVTIVMPLRESGEPEGEAFAP